MSNQEQSNKSSSPTYTIRCDKCWSRFSPCLRYSPSEIVPLSRHKPSTIETAHIGATITNEESELVRYDVEIKRLNRIVKKLKAEQSLLRKQLTIHRSWLAPIRALPLEIVTEIFKHVCLSEDYSLSITSNGRKVYSPPLTLSHVCTRWRKLALSQRYLWTSISVDLYRHRRDVRPFLRSYLRNSGEEPLSIHVADSRSDEYVSGPLDGDDDYATCHLGLRGVRVFFLLLESSPRVETLSLDISWKIVKSTIFRAFQPTMVDQCCFPILRNFRSFEVKGNENFHNFDFEQVCPPWLLENGIAAAPELAILRIHQLLIEHSLSYHQFTHLDVQWDKDPDHLLHVLGLCAELQVLQVRCFYGREEPPQVTPITLSALQSLHIGVSHSAFAQIQILFGSLTLPSLHSLELRFHMGDAPPNNRPIMARGIELGFPALLNMLIHSSDKLKKLSLVFFFYIPHDDIFEVLKSCPSLDTLELQCIPSHRHSQYHIQFVSFLIQRLILGVHPWSAHSWGTRNPPLLPKLRNLLIHMKSPATSPPEEMIRCILDMVESRSRSMNAISTDADPKTSLLQNVSISFRDIKEHCWKDSKDCRSLLHCSTLLDRLATLEEHGTKCMIEWSTQRGTASPRLPMYTDADSDELDEEDSD